MKKRFGEGNVVSRGESTKGKNLFPQCTPLAMCEGD